MAMTIDAASEIDRSAHGTSLLQRLAENPARRADVLQFLKEKTNEVIAMYKTLRKIQLLSICKMNFL
jgi:hypothetical protein